MQPHKPSYWIWMACLMLLPVGGQAQAYDEDYLRERTYNMDPSEMPRLPKGSGDYPEDFQYTGDPNVGTAQARRQRVETSVNQYMKKLAVHDDSEHEVSTQRIQQLATQAQKGDAKSMAGMGYAYQHGLGVEKNEKLAVQWYQRAAEYGESQYYSTIGDMYRDYGANTERGFFGDIRAMMGSGGDALRKDNAVARQWYEKGIQHPDKDWRSFVALGEMYRDGVGGLEKDMTRANAHYNRGMFIKKRIDEQTMRMVQKMARSQAEEVEGVDDVPSPPNRSYVPPQNQQENTQAIIIIDNARCTYEKSSVTRYGYSQIFSANCPDLRSRRLQVESVGMAGLECKVDQQSNGASVMLLCNAATQERVRIGNADCVMRAEPKREGYAAVFGAYCNTEPQAALPPVSYQGMTCEIEAGSRGESKTYTLLCGADLTPTTPQQQTAPTITGRIGAYSCSLRQTESPSTSYKFVYEAYCGGLTKEQKSSGAIPGSVSIGVNLCSVEPWPDNDEGKDFELYCR